MTTKMTANDIANLLERKWPPDAYVVLREVRNGTGFEKRARYADMLAISTWPSRGLYAIGVEIKVSASDFRREADDPDKADAIGKYCQHWYIAAPKGVIPRDELPDQWGLIECTAKTARTVKVSPKRETTMPDWLFFASLVRAVRVSSVPRKEHVVAVVDARNTGLEQLQELNTLRHDIAGYKRLRETVDKFQRQSGLRIDHWNSGDVGDAVKVLLQGGLKGISRLVCRLAGDMGRAKKLCDSMQKSIEDHQQKGDHENG